MDNDFTSKCEKTVVACFKVLLSSSVEGPRPSSQ